MTTYKRPRKKKKQKKRSKPMNMKSMIAVTCMGALGCFVLFALWYYYPYHELQFFVQMTDVSQEHYSRLLQDMSVHPKYDHYQGRHNKNNETLDNVSSINNNYHPFSVKEEEELFVTVSSSTVNDVETRRIFLKYLEPLCIHKNILSHDYLSEALPSDCNDLLESMMNISEHHLFDEKEVHALSQRIEFLSSVVPQNPIYLLIHIPHTAIQSIIFHAVSPNFKSEHIWEYSNATSVPSHVKVVHGKELFGFDKTLLGNRDNSSERYVHSVKQLQDGNDDEKQLIWISKMNYTYYTMLRDPVDHVVSTYYAHPNRTSLDEHIGDDKQANAMTHYVSGTAKQLIDGNSYMIARKNLINMGWVGLFEQLQRSAEQLCFFWGMHDASVDINMDVNKNFDKPSDIKLSVSQHQRILEKNKWDVMLYELGRVLYKQQEIVVKYGLQPN